MGHKALTNRRILDWVLIRWNYGDATPKDRFQYQDVHGHI